MTATRATTTGLVKSGHSYTLDGVRVPSVTTVLNGGVPKQLTTWAAGVVAAEAIDHWEELGLLPPSERYDLLRGAADRKRDAAMDRGTLLHALYRAMTEGEQPDIPEQYQLMAGLLVRLGDQLDLAPILVERPVLSRRYQYAGTPDLIADITVGGQRQTWLLDLKTGSGVRDSHALQLAGYRNADALVTPEGDEAPLPDIARCGVIHLTPDAVRLIELDAGDLAWSTFLHAIHVAHWTARCSQAWKAHEPWPVGAAVLAVP